jgi:hypothetical protein
MKTNKLSLVRETILPLSSDELAQVAGGAHSNCIPQPSLPRPRPSVLGTIGGTIGGPTGGTVGVTIGGPLSLPGNQGPWK